MLALKTSKILSHRLFGRQVRSQVSRVRARGRGLTVQNFFRNNNYEPYIVQSGDTLYNISLSTGASLRELIAANNIRNPDVIIAGKQIQLPAAKSARAAPSLSASKQAEYTVAQVVPASPRVAAGPTHVGGGVAKWVVAAFVCFWGVWHAMKVAKAKAKQELAAKAILMKERQQYWRRVLDAAEGAEFERPKDVSDMQVSTVGSGNIEQRWDSVLDLGTIFQFTRFLGKSRAVRCHEAAMVSSSYPTTT
ncbi:hypothetical protein CYMTET_20359 [Cymbomonas tetramitiformis]|uniref:LysM domain-containing protein n=1 Tax=Cymbomonas tetramitiformis TaxID=36881 RepID=A0AAE0G5K7_9CHLO|nr:hypothetical protein CYMTET_20359 [Cymbomonas tetramitiformis]